MAQAMKDVLDLYIDEIKGLYGNRLDQVILYGSYARGDFTEGSDVDIMILLDMDEEELLGNNNELFDATYDFNMNNNVEIMPIAKSLEHFRKWVINYPFYANINREGIVLYDAARG